MHLETILMGMKSLMGDIKVDIKLSDKFGNALNGQEEVHVEIKCKDCLKEKKFNESDIPFLKDDKIKAVLKAQEGACSESLIANHKLGELYEVLDKDEIGYVSVNTYRYGTNIEFMYNPNGYGLDKRIEVYTPDVGFTNLEVGKKYYVCRTKYFYFDEEEVFRERVLQKIELRVNNGYDLYFSGLDYPVETLTRGYAGVKKKSLNRLDHVVVASAKSTFIGGILKKLGSYYHLGGKNEGIKKLLDIVKNEM